MTDHREALERQIREIDIATGRAAAACLPGLVARLRHHQARPARNPLLALYRRWRIGRLGRAVAEARRHVEAGHRAHAAAPSRAFDR